MSAPRTAEGFVVEACRSCNAPVVWASTKHGKSMPVDAEPVDDGNVELAYNGSLAVPPVASVLTGPSLLGGPLRKSHFATCPDAEEWRRFA